MLENEKLYQIALLQIEGIGPIISRKLISYFKNAENIFKAPKKEFYTLGNPGIFLFDKIKKSKKYLEIAEKEINFCQQNNINISSISCPDYPSHLKNIDDAPQILYHKGKSNLDRKKLISIVGTRKCTNYGIEFCNNLCSELKPYNATIVSGLAYGIDYYAHKYAMYHHLNTFSILGNGLQYVYPRMHQKITNKIQENGLLISEFISNTPPSKYSFPKRNRIIAGISDAVIVLESPKKGGAMITARLANSYNKDVFALPGNIHSNSSAGCNLLIKNHEALLLDAPTDLIKILSWNFSKKINQSVPFNLKPIENDIYTLILENENISIDKICHKMKLNIGDLMAILTILEMRGIINKLPGKIFRVNN